MPSDAVTNLAKAKQRELAAFRHHRLCTAVPFPELEWSSDSDRIAVNFKDNRQRLHNYALDLAYSAIDWYSDRSWWSKLWSWSLRGISYFCALVGAVVPLIKVFVRDTTGGMAAEFALVMIALAAALNVIDRLAGFSRDWMRQRAVISQLDQERIKFELEWNDFLMQEARLRSAKSQVLAASKEISSRSDASAKDRSRQLQRTATKASSSSEGDPGDQTTFLEKEVDLVYAFCLTVLKILGEETTSWEEEFSRNIAQFADHIQAGTFTRRPAR